MEHLKSVESSSQKDDAYPIIPNCVVDISPRTWPGINKMGGVARVLNCHYDDSEIDCKVLTHLDVEYIVVGGKEKKVPIEYCKAAPQYDAAFQNGSNSSSNAVSNGSSKNGKFLRKSRVSLRDRSSLLGRCKLCGSLRSDCGSCDWVEEERKRREAEMQKEEKRMDKPHTKSKPRKHQGGMKRQPLFRFEDDFGGDGDSNSHFSSSNSSSDESYVIRTNTMDRRKRKGWHHPRVRSILSSSSSDRSESGLSSDESSDDEFLSMRLRQLSRKFEAESSKQEESKIPSSSSKVGRLYAKRMLRNRRKSDKKFTERMKFLDEQLQNSVGQPLLQMTNTTSNTNGSSVLEHLPLSGDMEDMDIDHSVEGYTETSRKESCNLQLRADIEGKKYGAEVNTNDGQNVYSNDAMQGSRREERCNRNYGEDAGDDEVDENEIQNDDLPREERIGIVDGEGIGESEVDQSENIQYKDAQREGLIPRIRRPLYQVARPEDIEGFYQDDMGTFIQPEGEEAAEKLPLDLVDRSVSVKFIDLPKFVFEIMKKVLEVEIPRAQKMTGKLEKDLDDLKSMPREEYRKSMVRLEMECFRHCKELSVRLIQEGTDQCQCGIKRYSNRDELDSNGPLTKRKWRSLQDTLDIKYDELDKEVDSILRAANGVLRECSHLATFEKDESDGSHSLVNGDNDIIYYSSSDNEVYPSKGDILESEQFDLVHDQNSPTRKWYGTGKVRRNRGKSRKRNYVSSTESNIKKKQKRNSFYSSAKSADFARVESKKKSRRRASGCYKQIILNEEDDSISNHRERASLTNNRSASEVEISSSQSKTRDGIKSRYQSKRKEAGHHSKKRTSRASGSAQIPSLKNVNLDVHHLFSELQNSIEETAQTLEVTSFSSIHEALEQLSLVYPEQVSRTVLQEIPVLLDSASINRCLAKDIFKSILNALRVTGRHSLQELIQGGSDRLRPHIDLLCCILALMRRKLHRYLEVHDGFLYKVFSTKSKESIVSLIVSQIIDVLYSNLLPSHWGMAKMLDEDIYCALMQLRNGLGFLVHPLETLCQVLVNVFPSQEWRRSNVGGVSGEKWYVSSIDPEVISNFWREDDSQGSTVRVSKKISRLMKFKKNRPREEIEAIWCLLAWFAKAPTVEKDFGEFRWKLIISLFTYQTGVLGSVGKNEQNKRSSPSQLIQCTFEIGYLCALLKSGALDPIPSSDDLLAKLFSKLIHLNADSESTHFVRGFEELRKMPSRGETRAVFKSWLESDISNLFPNGQTVSKTNASRLLADLYTWSPTDMLERKLCLSSPSKVLKSGIFLIECWLSRLPDKKVRWTRLGDRLTTLLTEFVKEVESGPSHVSKGRETSSVADIADAFSESFAAKMDYEAPKISNNLLRIAFRCEAIVFVTICARHMRDNFKTEGDRKFPLKINEELCKKIWILLADERLKEHKSHVSKYLNVLQNHQEKKKSSIFAAYIIMKLFSSFLFQIMAELESRHSEDPAELDFYSEQEADSFIYMMICLISCIAATSEDLTNIFHADRSMKSMVDTSLPIRSNDTLTSANTISCGLFWLSSIFHQIGVLYASNINAIRPLLDKFLDEICPRVVSLALRCMKAVTISTSKETSFDLCYRTSLTTLRNIFHIIGLRKKLEIHPFHRKANTESINETEEDDEIFDDIDDSFFMAVDLENPVPRQTITKSQAEEIFIRVGGQEVWKFLIKCLEQSKPSMRHPTVVTLNCSSNEDFQFSLLGKLVCARHAADVCALLTSICCIRQDKVDIVNIAPIPIQETDGVIHKDVKYQRNVRQVLSASLCHVAKFSTFSMNHVESALETILGDFIAACGCADTPDTFPTCNEVLMRRIGGDANCKEEQRQLSKVQQKYAATVRKNECFHADTEGSILRRQRGDFYDSLEAGFMSGHLWTFGVDLGILMERTAKSRSAFECQFLKQMSSTLQNSNSDIESGLLRENCSSALKALPQVSLERECLKRAMKFQSILSVCLGLIEGSRLASSVIISVSSTLLLEISETAHSVGYREVNSKSSRESAKARVLFSAYSNFVIPILSWLMPQLANIQDQKMVEVSHKLFKNVFLPCLNCCDLITNGTSRTIMPLSTLKELQVVACRYLEMYAIYAGNLSTEEGENSRTNLFLLMKSLLSLDQTVFQNHVQFPFLAKRDTTRKPKDVCPNLAAFVDRYMTLLRPSDPHTFAQNASIAPTIFRRFAVQYMASRLKQSGSSILEQENALQLLLQLVTTESLTISILNQDEKDKIQLKTEICDILHGFFLCIHNSLKSQDIADRINLIIQCFQCVHHVMIMKAGNKSLLEWCRSEHLRDESGYILACVKVLINLANHLTDPQQPDFVRHYGRIDIRNTTQILDEFKTSVADVTRLFEILQLPTANSINHQYKKKVGGMKGDKTSKETTIFFDEKAETVLNDFCRHLL